MSIPLARRPHQRARADGRAQCSSGVEFFGAVRTTARTQLELRTNNPANIPVLTAPFSPYFYEFFSGSLILLLGKKPPTTEKYHSAIIPNITALEV